MTTATQANTATQAATSQPTLLLHQLRASREFFERSTRVLTEENSSFAPKEGMMTAAQQVAHVADTFDWFHDALLELEGFDMDFEAMLARIMAVTSLSEARAWFAKAHDRLIAFVESSSAESLAECLPADNPIMPGASRAALLAAVVEHAAHHRGSLAVYSRLLDLVPAMPYGEMG